MFRLQVPAVPLSLFALFVLGACVGEGAAPVREGTDAGVGVDGGGDGQANCQGDTIEACGAACTPCRAPAGGTVACVNGVCEPKCGADETACDDSCVATAGSAAHCGRCNHACGAGQCSQGVCQPFAVATGFTDVHAIAISSSGLVISADDDLSLCANADGCTATGALGRIRSGVSGLNDVTVSGSDVYFDGNSGDSEIVWRCPIAGCPAGGAPVIENVVNDAIGRVVAGPNHVYWTRYDSYYGPYSRQCALPTCAGITSVRPQITSGGPYYDSSTRELATTARTVSVGAVSVLWATGGLYSDSTKQLRSCKLASACATPTEIGTDGNSVSALTYFDGKHYGASQAEGGGNVIFSVDDAAPSQPTFLVSDAAGITDLAVDPSGIYWVNGTTGKVHRCGALSGCAGAGETLVTGQSGAKRIRLDEKFIYWMTSTAVFKVAK